MWIEGPVKKIRVHISCLGVHLRDQSRHKWLGVHLGVWGVNIVFTNHVGRSGGGEAGPLGRIRISKNGREQSGWAMCLFTFSGGGGCRVIWWL